MRSRVINAAIGHGDMYLSEHLLYRFSKRTRGGGNTIKAQCSTFNNDQLLASPTSAVPPLSSLSWINLTVIPESILLQL